MMEMIVEYMSSPVLQNWFDPHWLGQMVAFSMDPIVLNTSKVDPRLRRVQTLGTEAALAHDSHMAPYTYLSVVHGITWTLVGANRRVDFWGLQHFLCGEAELWGLGFTFMILRECVHGFGHGAFMRAASQSPWRLTLISGAPTCRFTKRGVLDVKSIRTLGMSAAAICGSDPKIRKSLVYLCGEGVYHNLFTLAAPVPLQTRGWTSMCADVPVPAPCFRAFLRYGNTFFSNEAKTFNFQKGGLDAECTAVEHLPTLIADCLQISDVYVQRSCIWGVANFAFDHPKCVKASSLGMCAQTKSLTMICIGAVYWRPIFSVREVNEPEYASPTWPSRCEGLATTWGGEPYNWCLRVSQTGMMPAAKQVLVFDDICKLMSEDENHGVHTTGHLLLR